MTNLLKDLSKNYQWTTIRLLTYQAPEERETRATPFLVFVTLHLARGYKPTESTKEVILDLKKGGELYFTKHVLKTEEALRWYRNAGEVNFTVPVSDASIPLVTSCLADSPIWPRLALPVDVDFLSPTKSQSSPLPFIGARPSLVHRRLGKVEDDLRRLLQQEKAQQFVRSHCFIDFESYPEYLGGLILVVPDLVIKRISHFFAPREDGGENLVYHIVGYPESDLSKLHLTIIIRNINLVSTFKTVNVPSDGIVVFPCDEAVGSSGYVISHDDYGVIDYSPVCTFLRKIDFSITSTGMSVDEARKDSYFLTDKKDSDQVYYYSEPMKSTCTEKIDYTPEMIVAKADHRRKEIAYAEELGQQWFHKTRREAISFFRKHIKTAKEQVFVIDPYFGEKQFPQFLTAVTNKTINIKILTTYNSFDFGSSEEGKEKSKLRLQNFQAELEKVVEKIPNTEVKVLTGKKQPLHDRFLVIDDRVWFLGNSLNSLAIGASQIIRLPDGLSVIEKLNDMFESKTAKEFYAYATEKRRVAND